VRFSLPKNQRKSTAATHKCERNCVVRKALAKKVTVHNAHEIHVMAPVLLSQRAKQLTPPAAVPAPRALQHCLRLRCRSFIA